MNNNYLIPANSKKSILYFGLFTTFDLILFGSGLGLSLILVMIIPLGNFLLALLAISPGVISGFLVFPVPYYHNVLTFLKSVIRFYTERRKYPWKGWCFLDEKENK
ncbi:MAG: hypothetical protein GX247_01410 [Mollicutes bacterium]|jgi:hypothetical protein|nr:hypothetical protein [Mollicutes bacterium]